MLMIAPAEAGRTLDRRLSRAEGLRRVRLGACARRMVSTLAALTATISLLATYLSSPASAYYDAMIASPVTIYATPSAGAWDDTQHPLVRCDGSTRSVRYEAGVAAYPASGHSPAVQTLYVQHHLEYYANGTWWDPRDRYSTWRSAGFVYDRMYGTYLSAKPAGYAELPASTGGFSWRLVTDFRWYVGSTQIGRVINVYNPYSYFEINGAATRSSSTQGACVIF